LAGLPKPIYFYDMSGFCVQFKKDNYNEANLREMGLNERQIKGALFAKEKNRITNKDYQGLNNCSRNTASNDLADLLRREIFISSDIKGAGAFYQLK
jgi:ATP-dependent DNA helicase RecG